MKSRRNVVAAVALLALLNAGPAAAEWDLPTGGSAPPDAGLEDVCLLAHWGLQILQVAL
jgi:hypothetical protein